MKIRTTLEIISNRYHAQVEMIGFTATEEEKLAEFGQPLVEVGGTFSGQATRPGAEAPVEVEFTLPTRTLRLVSDFPAKQVFDLDDDANSDVMAKVWLDVVVNRCSSAKNTLIARSSTFEGESVVTV